MVELAVKLSAVDTAMMMRNHRRKKEAEEKEFESNVDDEKKKVERKSIDKDVEQNRVMTNEGKSRESMSRGIAQARGVVAKK